MSQAAHALMLLGALPQGVVVVDASRRLVYANPAFWANVGVDPALCPPGTPHRDLARLLAYRGVFGPGDPEELAESVLALDRSRHFSRRLRRADGGCWVELVSVPLPDGGFATLANDVTALCQAEAAAIARVEQLEIVLQRLRSGIAVYDAERRLAVTNPSFGSLVGLGGGSLHPGMPHQTIVEMLLARGEYAHVDAEAETEDRLRRDRSRPFSHQRQRPNGQVIRFDSQPMPGGGFMVEVHDVTPIKRAEDEARRRAALLDGVLEAMPHGVCVYGPDYRVSMFNQAYARIMEGAPVAIGDRLEDVVARRVASGEYPPEHGERALHRHRDAAAASGAHLRRIRPNGAAIDSAVARLPDGGHIAVITDVTALHRAEAEVRQRAAMLEAMLATIRHGIIMYGPDRRILATNAKAAELTGIGPELLTVGRLMDDVVDEQVQLGHISPENGAMMKAIDRSRLQRYSRQSPAGRILDIVSEPTPDGGYVLTYSDVTEDRRIRAELERAREAAEAGSAAKSRFLATMSHELRTPLNAVIGFSEAIAQERDRARIEEYAAAINDAGRQLLLLIDDILDVARSQTGALSMAEEPVEPTPLLQAVAAATAADAEAAGLTFTTDIPDDLPMLRGDARRLRQVLDKLLSNAMKFTPAGGHVALSARMEPDGLVIRVADTGIGIPPEDRERIFEPFTQLDTSLARRFHGSGLGLHLARTLAGALGATLALEDPEGPGIVAVLRFPPSRLADHPAAPEAPPGGAGMTDFIEGFAP